jgi:phospholipid transport system substrate-binding protein
MTRVTAGLAVVLLTTPTVWAATTPTDALRAVFLQADQILTDPGTEERPLERLLAVRKLVNEAFDFRSAAELASGGHWGARTTAEQKEFTWLFGDLLELAFVSRIASKASLERGTRIRYLSESVGEGTALVQTSMARRDGGDLLVDYHLIERDGSWKVRDVVIDGVSMMANYRAQLDRVLGNTSFPALLTQMRAMVGAAGPRARTASTVDVARAPTQQISLPAGTVSIVDVAPPAPEICVAMPRATTTEQPPIPAATERTTLTSAVRPPPRTRNTEVYWVQIMTSRVEAGQLVSRLRDGKHSVAVERTSVTGKPMINVRIGPFQDAEEAVRTLRDLQTKGHDTTLVAERE